MSLANNNLTSALVISTIAHYLPNLSNLSLENNQLRVWKDIDAISQTTDRRDKLMKLRELILIGNPIRDMEYQHNRIDSYKKCVAIWSCDSLLLKPFSSHIMRRFPTLEMLDGEPLAKISFDAPEAVEALTPSVGPQPASTTFPASMQQSFVTGVEDALVSGFLAR